MIEKLFEAARAHVRTFRNALVARDANRGNGADKTDDEGKPLVVRHLLLGLPRSQISCQLLSESDRGCDVREQQQEG
jgi:hypothetical protein